MIEIVITIAIVAILASVAVPSLSGFLRNNKLNAINGSLVESIRQARSEAIKLNRGVLVCASTSTKNACNASTNWATYGWLVCYDLNNDNVCDASSSSLPNPIRFENAVDTTFASVTGPSTPIRFDPTGAVASAATINVTGAWTGATTQAITVAVTGLVKGTRLQ